MSHFKIDLPGNKSMDVRKGTVFKKRAGFSNRWPWVKIASEVRIGYIVTIMDVLQKIKTQYHLLKTKEGRWLTGSEHEPGSAVMLHGKWHPETDDFTTLAIKKAIDDYENKQ